MSTCADLAAPSVTSTPRLSWSALDMITWTDRLLDAHRDSRDHNAVPTSGLDSTFFESIEITKAAPVGTLALFNAWFARPSTSIPDYLHLPERPQAFTTQIIASSTTDCDIDDSSASMYGTHINAADLIQTLHKVFTKYVLSSESYIDPEEGWKKTVLVVQTGIDDLNKRLTLEDQFYSIVDSKIQLRNALQQIIVSFR